MGGGTPTCLSADMLKRLIESIKNKIGGMTEFTVEANPESADPEKMDLFLDNGVNRISIGAQSFNDAKLKRLGRIHDSSKAKKAVMLARERGFVNISIDMIFGVRSETLSEWQKDLARACELPVKHISCYSLESCGLECDSDESAKMYEYAIDFLAKRGFDQYEISNFALNGYRCRHNLRYWDNEPYAGLGPSAVSYSAGTRQENINDLPEYMKAMKAGRCYHVSSEKLDDISRAKETAATKIRTIDGIGLGWFKKKTGFDFLELESAVLPGLVEDGLLKYSKINGVIRSVALSRKGIIFCDLVSSAFL